MRRNGDTLALTALFGFALLKEGGAFQIPSVQHYNVKHTITSSSRLEPRSRRSLFRDDEKSSPVSVAPILPMIYSARQGNHLHSTAGETSFGDEDNPMGYDRKAQLTKNYERGQYLFGAMGVLLLIMPDRTMTRLLASKCGGAAGYLLASGLMHILAGANDNDRLSSDTYKRLNIGLFGFCFVGLSAVPGEASFLPRYLPALLLCGLTTALKIYGTIISYVGWRRGCDNELGVKPVFAPKKMFGELKNGASETLKGMRVQNKKKALTYRNCLLLVCFGIFSAFMEGIFNIRYMETFNRTWFEISLQWSAISRLFMISTMIFSLKDAAERDRLTGTTFIQMNVMVGVWAVLVGLGQSILPFGIALKRGVEFFAFSLPFFIKALKSQKEKDEKKRESTTS